MKKSLPYTLIIITLFLSLFSSGCKKETDPGNDIAYISIHNATNIPLDFYIGEKKVNSATLSRGLSTNYIGVYQGSWKAEAILTDSASSTLERELNLTGNENTSLFVIRPDSLDFLMIRDDLNEKNADRPKIKFLNLSPDAGVLSLELELLDRKINLPGLSFKAFTPYQELDEKSSYGISLKSSTNESLVETEMSFERGKLYTIWATGLLNTTVEAQQLRLHITEVQ